MSCKKFFRSASAAHWNHPVSPLLYRLLDSPSAPASFMFFLYGQFFNNSVTRGFFVATAYSPFHRFTPSEDNRYLREQFFLCIPWQTAVTYHLPRSPHHRIRILQVFQHIMKYISHSSVRKRFVSIIIVDSGILRSTPALIPDLRLTCVSP